MTWQLILGFFVLLLPVPLGFLIPANPRARPDPRVVLRARYAAVLVPLFVAAIQLAFMVYLAFSNLGQPFAAGFLAPATMDAIITVWSVAYFISLRRDGGAR